MNITYDRILERVKEVCNVELHSEIKTGFAWYDFKNKTIHTVNNKDNNEHSKEILIHEFVHHLTAVPICMNSKIGLLITPDGLNYSPELEVVAEVVTYEISEYFKYERTWQTYYINMISEEQLKDIITRFNDLINSTVVLIVALLT